MISFFKKNIVLSIVLIIPVAFIYMLFTRDINIEPKDRTNKHFVNDLYLSNDFIYNQLTPEQQKLYDVIFNELKNRDLSKKLTIDELGCGTYENCSNELLVVHDAILVEHPDILNYSSFHWQFDGDILTFHFYKAVPVNIIADIGTYRIERIIDDIKRKTKNMTDAEKILYVYEWIGDHATYDRIFTFSSKNQSIYNVFINHNAVCAGFAKAATVIFQNIGIEAYGVTGYMHSGDSVGHMWNIVKLDGKYYFFDSTVSASINDKNNEQYHFGLIQLELSGYQMDYPEWYPKIETGEMPGVIS